MSSLTCDKVFVGLDYHQDSVQVCVLTPDGQQLANGTRPNCWEEVARVVPSGVKVFAAIEACCGAADFADELTNKAGWSVDLAHAGYVHKMKQNPDKTDYTDARLLAELNRVGFLPRVWHAPTAIRDLRRLIRYRQQLANQRRSEKLRCSAILRDLRIPYTGEGRSWSKPWREWITSVELGKMNRWVMDRHLHKLAFLEAEIKLVEKQLNLVIAEDKVCQWLLKQDGIGPVTAVTMRAEIGRFDRFRNGKQLAKYCAVTPWNASSGNRQADAGLIKSGNRELRRVLIEAAHRLKNSCDRWAEMAEHMRSRGKAAGVITAAVANRWLRGLYHQAAELESSLEASLSA